MSKSEVSAAKHTPGLKGHARTIAPAGKFSHTYKPRCACGWVGFAQGTRFSAILLHRNHVEEARAAIAKATGSAS